MARVKTAIITRKKHKKILKRAKGYYGAKHYRFRGRELNYVKLGESVLNQFIENLSDIAVAEKKPILEGKNLFIILAVKSK